jgi:hypothetical protein
MLARQEFYHLSYAASPRKSISRLLKKSKIELTYDAVISLLGIYPNKCKSGYNKDTCTHNFSATMFTTAKL